MFPRTISAFICALCFSLMVASPSMAQGIPQPSGPVAICGKQTPPPATSYKLVFDGGAPEDITPTPRSTAGPATTACETADPEFTHSFTIPAARFTVGNHTVRVFTYNGTVETQGPTLSLDIVITAGPFVPTAAVPLPPGEEE